MIKDTKTYTLLQIVELGVLGKSHHTVSSAILRDRLGQDLLQSHMTGGGQGARYQILGRDLKQYIKHREAAKGKRG